MEKKKGINKEQRKAYGKRKPKLYKTVVNILNLNKGNKL